MATCPITSGLKFLLDSRSSYTGSNGDSISTLIDQSSKSNNATASANKPTYKANAFGSFPSINFNNQGANGTFSGFGSAGLGYTLIGLLANVSAVSGGIGCIHSATTDVDTSGLLMYTNASILGFEPYFNGGQPAAGKVSQLPISSTPVVAGVGVSSTEYLQIVNGQAVRGTRSGAIGTSTTGFTVGARFYSSAIQPTNSFTGDMFLWACYNFLFTRQQTFDWSDWALSEFGVRTLPSSGGTTVVVIEDD